MNLMEALIAAKIGNRGGSVTPQSVLTATEGMTEQQAEDMRAAIGAVSADEIGNVFTIKGSVATTADLPATGNSIGDVYYVEAAQAGYVWITSTRYPDGYWEELGEPIDLSAYELKPTVVTLSGMTQTIAAADNAIYQCGELTSLTVSSFPASGIFEIIFTSGSTPTVTNFPTSIKFPTADNLFEGCEANTRYEINVSDGYALVGSWPVGA